MGSRWGACLVYFDAGQDSLSGQAVHKGDVLRAVLSKRLLEKYGP